MTADQNWFNAPQQVLPYRDMHPTSKHIKFLMLKHIMFIIIITNINTTVVVKKDISINALDDVCKVQWECKWLQNRAKNKNIN